MEELVLPSGISSNNDGDARNMRENSGGEKTSSFLGDQLLLGDGRFNEGSNPSSIIVKVIGQDGSYYIDPAQFSDINFDDCEEVVNPINNAPFHAVPFQINKSESQVSKEPNILRNQPTESGGKSSARLPSSSQTPIEIHVKASPLTSALKTKSSLGFPPAGGYSNPTPRAKPTNPKQPKTKKTVYEVTNKPNVNVGEGPFHCSICQKEFTKWPAFRRHKAEHLDEKSFRCDQCPSSFNYEANLKLHGMLHEAEKSGCLQCQVCSAKLSRLASLRSHIRIHEKEENLVCAECGDEFPTKGRLEAHLDVHRTRTQQMLHRCRFCGKSFNQAALLKDHAKEHSAVKKELKYLNAKKRKPKLTQASVPSGTNSSQLSSRPPRSEAKKLRSCHVCGKRFEKPSQLQRHIRVHTGEKPFECKHCNRRFNQKGTLDSHILATHEKVKPHICQLCSCKFSQRGNLKAHMLKVHVTPAENENAFRCLECTCVYRRLATLNNHIAKVHAVHSYPRGLISISKNAPKLVPADPRKSVVVTTMPNAVTYTFSETGKVKAVSTLSGTGQGYVEANKTTPLAPNQSTNMIMLGTGDTQQHQQPQTQAKGKPESQNPQEPVSEVHLIHNEQGKAGSCKVTIKKVGETKYHLCSSCSKAFRKPSDLIRHMRVHTQEKPYTCYVCDKAFAVNSTLKQHLRTHMGVKELECQTCKRKFAMLSSLRAHERLHTGAKPFPCLYCGKCFRTSGQRRIHTRIHTRNPLGLTGRRKLLKIGENQPHVDLPDPLKITEDGQMIPVMNRSVHTLGTVGSTDGKPRKYKCKMCPKSFKKSSHLKQHIRSHTGERPYQCFQCHRSFVSSGVLKNHIKTHEGVRAFQCSTCKLSFTTNGSLTRHMATHSNARNFMCPHCQKKFKTSVACRKHIKTHRREIVAYSSSGIGTYDLSKPELTPLTDTSKYTHTGCSTAQSTTHPQIQHGLQGLTTTFTEDDFLTELDMDNVQQNLGGANLPHINSSFQTSGPANSVAPVSLPVNFQPQSMGNGNGNVHIQQIQDANGYVTLQYTIQAPEQQLNQNIFDPTSFSLAVDSLDLPTTNQYSMTEHTESPAVVQTQTVTTSTQSYEYFNIHSQSKPAQEVTNTTQHQSAEAAEAKSTATQSLHDLLDSQVAAAEAESKKEVEKIRESSRPISMKIYNELKAQEQKSREARSAEYNLPPGKWNQCQFCDRAFKKRSDLQRHLRIHTGEKPFKCHICSKTFRVKSTREVHMRVHTGGKSVSCHVCNNLFATKSSLRVHMRLHTNSKPYKCPHPNCERWFRTSGHRKAHIQSHFKAPRKQKPFSTSTSINSATKVAKRTPTHMAHRQTTRTPTTSNPKTPPSAVATSSQQPLPSVQVLQRKTSFPTLEMISQSNIGNLTNLSTVLPPAHSQTAHVNQETPDPSAAQLQVLNNIQLAIDGPTIQITGLDLNSFQLDENFLQNVTIFIPPMNSMQVSSEVMGNNNQNGNNILYMPTGSETAGAAQDVNSVELTKEELNTILSSTNPQQSTPTFSLLNDLNLGLLQTVQLSQNTNSGMNSNGCNDLNLDVNSMSQYVINNNAMMSSTAIQPSTESQQEPRGETKDQKSQFGSDNRKCGHCSKVFAKPSLLARHARIHTGEKPFRCKTCRKAFSQKSSLIAHSYVHSNDKPFHCPSCTFRTVQRAALRKHFSKAHPTEKFPETPAQDQQPKRSNKTSAAKSDEILGV